MFQAFLLISIAMLALWFWQGSQLFFSPPVAAETTAESAPIPEIIEDQPPPILGQTTGQAATFISQHGQLQKTTPPFWPALVAADVLPFADVLAERGEQIFIGAIFNNMHCAACHAISESTAKNTTAPILLHSAWNLRFFQDGQITNLAAAIRNCQSRQHPDAELAEADIIALVNYLNKLAKPTRFAAFLRGEATLSDAELNGLKILEQQGCLFCHQGVNLGTNNLIDKQFLEKSPEVFRKDSQSSPELMRVPSLRNLGYRSGFLADGSADLTEAIQHLQVLPAATKLTEQELADIKAFLATLNQDFPDSSGVNDVAAP